MPNLFFLADYMITLNIKDFLMGVLIIALIVLVIFFIALIGKAIQNLSTMHKILKLNKEHISEIVKNAGSISGSVSEITSDIAHATDVFKPTVDNVATTSESVTKTLKDNNPVNEVIMKAYGVASSLNKAAKKQKNKNEAKTQKTDENK